MKFILDNGHSGVVNGEYLTKGKRSWFESTGHFYEGVYNRIIVSKLIKLCKEYNIPYHNLVPEDGVVHLSERIKREHNVYEKGDILLSIHCDAYSKESANGFSTFTYKNISSLSKTLNMNYAESNTDIRNRGCKTANFYMLRKSKSKAILIECGFMTNLKDCLYLINNTDNVVMGIFNFMLEVYEK